MMYELPTSLEVCGAEYAIESDYRAILDIFSVLADEDLSPDEKCIGVLGIFYLGFFSMPEEHMEDAVQKCYWFINGGNEDSGKKAPKLMDWEQDFQLLVAPINRIAGAEIRSAQYLHWWTFLSYYGEIGDCYFAHIVRIRDLKARGRLSSKDDKEFYRRNKDAVDIKVRCSDAVENAVNMWT